MKLLAIIDVAPSAAMEVVRNDLANELKQSWSLFVSGVLREAYATASPTRLIFVLEAESAAHAGEQLRGLPLIAAGHFRFELIELRPFANWSILFSG